MPPVPVLRPAAVVKAFKKPGWEVARQRGSHIIMTIPGHLATLSIPDHSEVARGTQYTWREPSGLRPQAQAWTSVDAQYLEHF